MNEPLAGLVVALDDASFDDLIGAVEVMVQQGLRNFAFHASTPDLATWVGIYGTRARVGVHRATSAGQIRDAVAAGASFVLADRFADDLPEAAGEAVLYIPAMTPTEIAAALARPVAGVQVSPAEVLGPNFADAVAEFGLVERCVPRGGLGAYAASRWFKAGAKAAVVDSQLLGNALEGGDLNALRDRCGSFVDIQPALD